MFMILKSRLTLSIYGYLVIDKDILGPRILAIVLCKCFNTIQEAFYLIQLF